MKPNLFDDLYEIEDEKNIDDELIDGHYPHTDNVENYKSRGYIKKGDIIEIPLISKDVHVGRYVTPSKEPGFISVMNTISGEDNWGCHSGAYTFNLTKATLVYECLPYVEEEMDEAKQLCLAPKDDLWIASKRSANTHDSKEEYDYMAALFCASDKQEYNVFACCSIHEPQSRSIPCEDWGIKFIGVFALDRFNSFIQHRIIFHQVSDRMRLQ